MSVLDKLNKKFKLAAFRPPSSEEDIQKLIEMSTIDIPQEYISLIREKTELEFLFGENGWLRIWGADGCREINPAYDDIEEYLPNSLVIGDDGRLGAIMYLHGNKGFGVYLCRVTDLDIDKTVFIAPSLEELLINGVGIDCF